MDLDAYRRSYAADDAAPGWDAIDEHLAALYGAQEPLHLGTGHPYALGGPDPLDGISIYRSGRSAPHLHFVTYGMSELYYSEKALGGDFSRFGFEFSFRLAPTDGPEAEPSWVAALLQNIARYVYQSKRWFEPYHFIPANGPIRLGTDTAVTALATVMDPELGAIDTVHGRVEFIQFLGITQAEYDTLRAGTLSCRDFIEAERKANPMFITRLARGVR